MQRLPCVATGPKQLPVPWCTLARAQCALREERWQVRVICDLLRPLPVLQLFVSPTLRKKRGHFDHQPSLGNSQMFVLPLLCKRPCPYASTPSNCVYIYIVVFCFPSLEAQQLFLFRLVLTEIFFFFQFHFFFLFLSGPALFLQVCVFLSLTGVFMRAAALKATYIMKRAGVSYRRYIYVAVSRY